MAEKFINVMKDVERNVPDSITEGLRLIGDELLRISGNRVPLELGTLRNSGKRPKNLVYNSLYMLNYKWKIFDVWHGICYYIRQWQPKKENQNQRQKPER